MKLPNPFKNIIEKRAKQLSQISIEKFVDDGLNSTIQHNESNYAPETKEDYSLAFERSIWSYACVYAIASNAASVPLRLYKKGTDDEITTGPLYDLINYPNTQQGYYDFMEALVSYLELTGDGFIELNDGKNPTEMKTIRSYWMEIRQERDGSYKYDFKPNGVKQTTLDDDVVCHIKYFHPNSELYGFSGMQAATNSLIQDFYVTNYSKKYYEKGGMIGMYVAVKQTMQDFEFKRMKQEIKTSMAGVKSSTEIPLLDSDSEIKQAGNNIESILLKANRDQYRDEILTAFGVPLVMLAAIGANTTFDNANTMRNVFWQATMMPKLRKIQDAMNRKIFIKHNVEARFDLSGIQALKEDEQKKATIASTLTKGGIITTNEARSMYYDLEPIEGGDSLQVAAPNPFADAAAAFNKSAFITKPIKKNRINDAITVSLIKTAIDSHNKVFDNRELATIKALKPVLDKMMNKVLDKLPKDAIKKADYSKTIASSLDSETAEMMKTLIEQNKETMRQSATESFKRSSQTMRGLDARVVSIIDANSRQVTKWAEESADSIIGTYQDRITNYLDRAATEGLEIDTVRKGIQEMFIGTDRDSYPRAQMIARTEVGRMVNRANVEAAKDMGFKKKTWISTDDSKCRDTHRIANGQKVDMDEPFNVGDSKLMYPGDTSLNAPPEETIQCRCTTLES